MWPVAARKQSGFFTFWASAAEIIMLILRTAERRAEKWLLPWSGKISPNSVCATAEPSVKWTRRPSRTHEKRAVISELTFVPRAYEFTWLASAWVALDGPGPYRRSPVPLEVRKEDEAEGNQHHGVAGRRGVVISRS